MALDDKIIKGDSETKIRLNRKVMSIRQKYEKELEAFRKEIIGKNSKITTYMTTCEFLTPRNPSFSGMSKPPKKSMKRL